MKWSFAVPLTAMLLLFPLLTHSQDVSVTQQSQDKQATAVEPITTNPSSQSSDRLRESMREHFQVCDQTIDQARGQAHKLSRDANQQLFNVDSLGFQHKQLQEQMSALKKSREQLLGDLSAEQQQAVQDHSQSMQQLHDRIQVHMQTIDQELTGSNLHLKVISDEAKAAEREMKSYHKHLQETGKAFNLLAE